jgi:hypothetical protein
MIQDGQAADLVLTVPVTFHVGRGAFETVPAGTVVPKPAYDADCVAWMRDEARRGNRLVIVRVLGRLRAVRADAVREAP